MISQNVSKICEEFFLGSLKVILRIFIRAVKINIVWQKNSLLYRIKNKYKQIKKGINGKNQGWSESTGNSQILFSSLTSLHLHRDFEKNFDVKKKYENNSENFY